MFQKWTSFLFSHIALFQKYIEGCWQKFPQGLFIISLRKNTCTSYFLHVFSFFFLLIKCGLACSRNYLRGWVIIVVIELNLGFCSLQIASIENCPLFSNIIFNLIMEFNHGDSNQKLQNLVQFVQLADFPVKNIKIFILHFL